MIKPENCNNKAEVRAQIDAIDKQIMELFGKRQHYVERIVEFKSDEKSVVAQSRQDFMLSERRQWAKELGLDENTFEQIFKTLIHHNIQRELNILNDQP